MDRKILDAYESGGEKLRSAIAGLSLEDLLWVPGKDEGIGLWSIQQIVIHLMDAELILTSRMKLIIAEDHPRFMAFDETKWTANLFYEKQDAAKGALIVDLNRKQFAKALRKLPDSAFERTGEHNERGPQSLEQILRMAVEHLENHLKFVLKKREKMGKGVKV